MSSQYEISLRLHTAFAGDQTITALPHALLGDVLAEKLGPGRYKVFQGGEPLSLTESLSNLDLDDDCRLTVTLTLTLTLTLPLTLTLTLPLTSTGSSPREAAGCTWCSTRCTRYRGGVGEMWGRCRGDIGEI